MDPRVEELIELLKQLVASLDKESEQVAKLQEVLGGDDPQAAIKAARSLAPRIAEEQKTQHVAAERAVQRARDLEDLGGPIPPTMKPTTLARQFRAVVDALQEEVQTTPSGDVGTTLRNMDVEVKGLIVVEDDQAGIVTPTPGHRIDPGQLSVIRMSFGTVPRLQPSADEP